MKRWEKAIAGREEQIERASQQFGKLLMLMADLHGPAGCPWDKEQSLASLRQYVNEEANEVCTAIDEIITYEERLRTQAGLPPANPQPPTAEDKARTDKKGHTIGHHPHHQDFNPTASATGAPLPREILSDANGKELKLLYQSLNDELGDFLLQAAFIGDILEAMGRPGVDASLDSILTKLIRRHPHVYGDQQVKDSAEVLVKWEEIKRRENQHQ